MPESVCPPRRMRFSFESRCRIVALIVAGESPQAAAAACGASRATRYRRERPGELLHVDTKQLGRFFAVGKRILQDGLPRSRRAGWQHLHVAIDDHTRLAYTELLPSARKEDCTAFLTRAVAWYAEQAITIERVLSDNAKAYHSNLWRDTCSQLAIERRYTRPYSPWTNGKAEALIKTLLRESAYRFAYPTSTHRARALPSFTR